MTGAILPGGATMLAAATNDCQLDTMLAHDLEALRVWPGRRSSQIGASRRFFPLVGRFGPAADVVACAGSLSAAVSKAPPLFPLTASVLNEFALSFKRARQVLLCFP